MITELFILGGVAFWILSGIMILLLLWAASDDSVVTSGLLVAGYVVAIFLFGNAGTIQAPGAWVFYLGIPAYLVIGTGWGIGKWYLFVSRQVMSYKEARQEFLINSGIAHATVDMVVPVNLRAHWKRTTAGRLLGGRPVARQNKRRIISWMCFWPTSMLWAVIDEPWRRIYSAIASLLQRISDSVYDKAGVDADLKGPNNLHEALLEQIAGYDANVSWDRATMAEALKLAISDMKLRELRVNYAKDGGVTMVVPPDQRVPHLPSEVKGVRINVVVLDDTDGSDMFRGGKPAK